MWNFQRIICIWICCVSCMFGTTQLSSLVQAVPYEYFDDHDQSFYDLDTEQIQAKYDTRLLSQQMLKTEQQQHLESKKDSHITKDGVLVEDSKNIFNIKNHNDAGGSSYILTKLKTNDAQHHHHAVVDDWLEETATITSTSASAVTEKEEIHLPRAASCYTNGHKYTHGQKVPRLDSCEVCLCMDGEIFCWWEKCDKKPATQSTIYDDYSTRYEESSTTRIQLNPKTTYRTTLKPMKKPKIIQDYKYDDDDSAEIREMQQEYEGIKEQLKMRKQQQHKTHNKQMVKKKIYQQYEEEKHNKKLKEQQNIKKQQQQEEQQLEQKQHKANDHHHVHNKNNNHRDYGGSSGTSKILNFPENLPSVLYYDYKTEEHHQHQHQHHEQHLKHQKQKQQLRQHEKELKYRQQQQQQQQRHQQHHVNRHHEYGQNFNTYTQDVSATAQLTATPTMRKAVDNAGGPSTLKYFSTGNDNIYNVNLQTDSDILPEPPTKKPKLSIASETETATTTQPTLTISSTATITVRPLKKQNFSPWDYDKPNRDKINNNKNNSKNNNKNESSEDIMDSNDQDDAFHRWLTSTETNNKKTNSSSSYVGGSSDIVAVIGDGNSDYNIEDKNYENIDIDIEARAQPQSEMQLLSTTAKTIASVMTTSNAIEAATTIYDDDAKAHRNFENSRMTKYEQYFRDNNNMGRLKENLSIDNNNDITNTNTNNNNNNNFSPFSNPYQNNNNMVSTSNNRHTISPSASISGSSSFASNEDNGVANVVNIDIMLTASSAELQQQQQQLQSTSTDIKATHSQQQQQQQVLSLQDLEHEKQISTQLKFVKPPVLISNTNDVDNNKLLSSITNNNSNTNNNSTTNIVGGLNAETTKTMGVNLLSISSNNNNNNNNSSATSSSQSSNDNFRFKHLSVVTQSTAQNFVDAATTTTTITVSTPPTLSTTSSPERLCNVMGTLYKIGDVLPQDTGNCLQCICIDGSTSDDTPRVTCSPHNCPPLVLPDLFDATGY